MRHPAGHSADQAASFKKNASSIPSRRGNINNADSRRAMVQTAASAGALKALTYRISSTPVDELPKIAPQIAGSIWNCRQLLSTSAESKRTTEETGALKQFNTQLTTLLQDRTIEGRWSAVILTKATIEAGGLEVLSKCNPWVRSLLGMLKKPDPATTRSLIILTLTRIFMLTWDFSNIVREITTPALTAFVPTCLANVENRRCSASELETVLESFLTLVPRHPTIFRTNEAKLRSFLAIILSSEPSNAVVHYTQAHQTAARRLLVALHHCAPKQGASEKWDETIRSAVHAAHSTCDRVLRTFQEDWQSVAGIEPSVPGHLMLKGANVELQSREVDAAGLKPWKGVYAGSERIITLLQTIGSHIEGGTAGSVAVPVGLISDLLTRLFSVSVPRSGKNDFVKLNNEIVREERDALFAVLPDIHAAAAELCITLLDRFGKQSLSFTQSIVDQALWVFKAESRSDNLRIALYHLFNTALESVGPSLSKEDVSELVPVFKSCCKELIPDSGGSSSNATNGTSSGIKQQLGLAGSDSSQSHPTNLASLEEAAESLLETALIRLDSACIAPQTRAQIDRTAVLTRSQKLLIASVMNPVSGTKTARGQASLMPILAREFAHISEVEALLRPRMPFIHTGRIKSQQYDEDEDELANGDDDGEDGESEDDHDQEDDEDMDEEKEIDHANPGAQASNSSVQESTAVKGKRAAADETDISTSAKRLRPSTLAESISYAAHGESEQVIKDDLHQTTIVETPASRDVTTEETTMTMVLPADDLDSAAVAGSRKEAGLDADAVDDSDGSDFEMPEINPEPDTDPEDE